jgi:hypothetical protein
LSPEPKPPTPQQAREHWLLRLLLLENLLLHVDLRRSYVPYLARRATATADERTTERHLDAIAQGWTLADNLLSVYETLGNKINITKQSQRRAIQTRVGSRTTTPKIRFHKRIWLYHLLTKLSDEVFQRAGVRRNHAESLLNQLIERSCATLQGHYETVATYHRKYRDIARAYKHGRALFPLTVTFATDSGTGYPRLNAHVDHTVVTAFQRNPDGTETATMFQPDEESEHDLQGVLQIAESQLPRLRAYVASIRKSCETFIGWLEGTSTDPLSRGPIFCFFAEPYTPAEEALLQALGRTETASP